MKAKRGSKTSLKRIQRAAIRRGGKSACFVYALKDETGAIRYVGQTRCPLIVRLGYHLKRASETGSPVERWLVGRTPEIVMLEKKAVWDVDEVLWIERLRLAGENLLNVTRGGRDASRRVA